MEMTNLDSGTDRRTTMGRGVRMAAIGTQTVGYVLAGWWLGGQLQPVWGEKVGALLGVGVGMTHLIRSAMSLQRSFEAEDRKK
jgi:F0F1-type ATP synthase assembly protein I